MKKKVYNWFTMPVQTASGTIAPGRSLDVEEKHLSMLQPMFDCSPPMLNFKPRQIAVVTRRNKSKVTKRKRGKKINGK